MQLAKSIAQTELTRQELLKLWFWKSSLAQADLARALGVAGSTVCAWMRREHLSSWRVAQLREFGIPEELLPLARDIPSGPKPKEDRYKG